MKPWAMLKTGAYVAASIVFLMGCEGGSKSPPPVVVEFRPAFDDPGEGLTPMDDPSSGATIYVSSAPIISTEDFSWAKAARRPDTEPKVDFKLTDDESARFAEATERMVGEKLAILVDGKVISAPIVQGAIVGEGEIVGRLSEEETRRIAAGINAAAR